MNIPTAEMQPVVEKELTEPLEVAYARRNRDLDPQLMWRGKDEPDRTDLTVQAPPLYIQEKVHPKVLIDDLVRRSKESAPPPEQEQLGLFFAGDLGQRIFQHPFSWKSLGVDVRGRSRSLRVNYRTSHQIRAQADRLLGPEVADVDGNVDDRRGTVSVFNGPAPQIRFYDDEESEQVAVSEWLREIMSFGVSVGEIGVIVRSHRELSRAAGSVELAGLPFAVLDKGMVPSGSPVTVSTMHLTKGLEFRAVAVMACDDEILPSERRMEDAGDDSDLLEVYDTERQLLYVACTRAREFLLVTSGGEPSEFREDLGATI